MRNWPYAILGARKERFALMFNGQTSGVAGRVENSAAGHVVIAIATAGRAEVLADTLDHLAQQTVRPDAVLVCPASNSDFDRVRASGCQPSVYLVRGPVGLPAQRNALMAATDADIMIFLDDDFLPAPDFVEEVRRLFAEDHSIVVATGLVLVDGILGAGMGFEEGRRVVDAAGANLGGQPSDIYNAYGCNMVIRLAPVREHGLRFDEALPLYAWQEDVDFSRQMAPYGRIVWSPRLRGVHLGTKRSGRSPGKRLGYAQIANPVYLSRKGTLSWEHSLRQIARNVAANAARSLNPEPWTDHRGRLRGNLLALAHLLTGRLSPDHILKLSN